MCYINPRPMWDTCVCEEKCTRCNGRGFIRRIVPRPMPVCPPPIWKLVPAQPPQTPIWEVFPKPWIPGPVRIGRGDYE